MDNVQGMKFDQRFQQLAGDGFQSLGIKERFFIFFPIEHVILVQIFAQLLSHQYNMLSPIEVVKKFHYIVFVNITIGLNQFQHFYFFDRLVE